MSSSERPVSPVRRLLPYFHRHRRTLVLGFGCILATTAIQLLSPWVLKFAVDDLTSGVTRAKLLYYAAVLFAIALVGGVFRFLMRKIVIGVSRHMEYDLRNDFFRHLQRLPPAFYQERRTGDLMSRATNDLNAVRMMAGPSVMYATQTTLVFVVAIILMVSIDPWLTMVALLPLPFVSVSVKVFGTAIHRRFERIQEQLSELSAVAQENLSGVRVVRAYGQERAELAKFRVANEEYIARNRGLIRLQGAFYPSLTLLLGLGALLVLWQGSREVIAGRITVGELVAFNAYLVMLAWPMIAFGWVTNMLQRGSASWKRMLEMLDVPPAIADPPAPVPLTCCTIARPARIAPPDLRLRRPAGPARRRSGRGARADGGDRRRHRQRQDHAAVGAAAPDRSAARHGLPRRRRRARPLAVDAARGHRHGAAGAVPLLGHARGQHRLCARGRGLPAEARRRAVEQAAGLARLDKDLRDFPNGYDTLVGERGITLSGGQKQRTSLARALVTEPRVLILDDALSAVDTYTEDEILHRLREVRRGRTCLIVSHRVSTVRDCRPHRRARRRAHRRTRHA